MNNIYIIGFMGTGKSATGRELARRMARDFIDLDAEIEREQGKTIKEIFVQDGEDVFRRLESRQLETVASKDKVVVACGGGIVTVAENVPVMKKTGKVLCLTASLQELENRTAGSNRRPLLDTENLGQAIRELFGKRLPLYKAAADITVDTTRMSPDQTAEFALTLIGKG